MTYLELASHLGDLTTFCGRVAKRQDELTMSLVVLIAFQSQQRLAERNGDDGFTLDLTGARTVEHLVPPAPTRFADGPPRWPAYPRVGG